ncbi:MAG: SH3 domain-containing protein [Anaerolineales bacterium]
MRSGAGTGYAVVRVLSEGEDLQVLERATWLKVIDGNGSQGFINSKYCK